MEKITLKMILTLSNGAKVEGLYTIENTGKPIRIDRLEADIVNQLNRNQPNMVNRFTKCHLMRN